MLGLYTLIIKGNCDKVPHKKLSSFIFILMYRVVQKNGTPILFLR